MKRVIELKPEDIEVLFRERMIIPYTEGGIQIVNFCLREEPETRPAGPGSIIVTVEVTERRS